MEPQIIFENKNFIILNKPSGWQVHPAKIAATKATKKNRSRQEHEVPLLTEWLTSRYPELKNVGDDPVTRPGIVHRLDKETSGIMIVPRSQKMFEYLKNLFQKREVKKTYIAIVRGALKKDKGIIDASIGIKSGTLKRSIHSAKMAKPAITEYRVIKTFDIDGEPYSLLEVKPKTGRTHQIRVHLASIGHPIIGDMLYGPKQQTSFFKRLMLHAKTISFADGRGGLYEFEAPAAEEFTDF